MIIVQLTDSHICRPGETVFGGRDSAATLARCIEAVNALRPSPACVMLSGDLVNTGHSDEYMHLKPILARLTAPYYLMPGNHDERSALRAAFPSHRYLGAEGFIQYAVEQPGLRVLALDTVVPGAEGGALDDERLQWLDAALSQRSDAPCLILMHHPAFETGIARMDQGRVQNAAFWPLVARHAHVKRVACGHLHRTLHTTQHGVAACIAPSTAAQLGVQLEPGAALEVTGEPPGFLIHALAGGEIVTHCVSVPA
jgi:3',5'-cyclic-AMP phosphodiesterase